MGVTPLIPQLAVVLSTPALQENLTESRKNGLIESGTEIDYARLRSVRVNAIGQQYGEQAPVEIYANRSSGKPGMIKRTIFQYDPAEPARFV